VVAKGGVKVKKSQADRVPDPDAASIPEAFYGTVQTRAIADRASGESATEISNAACVRETGDPYHVQRWEARDISFAGLADLLDQAAPLSLPIVDMTGLNGRYSLVLEVSLSDLSGDRRSDPGDAKPDREETALRSFNAGLLKLGLRLERRKGPLETIVIDHVAKTPPEN
jgi:uncharacterized protein (TIGR03435 family)